MSARAPSASICRSTFSCRTISLVRPSSWRRMCRRASGFKVKLEKILAEDFPTVVARVYPLELGPPVGWPVQYRVSGPDIVQVREIALKLAQVVATDPQRQERQF